MKTNWSDMSAQGNDLFEGDSIGKLFDTGVYDATIKYAYLTESKESKITGLNVVLDINGREFAAETAWLMYSDGSTLRVNARTGKKEATPGMKQFNSLCYCALGITPDRLGDAEYKAINVWNWEQKKQVPTQCPVYPALTGAKIKVGIKKYNKHKNVKVGTSWVPTKTIRTINTVDKYYTPDGKLAIEALQDKPAVYMNKWLEEYQGKVIDEKLRVDPIDDPNETNEAAKAESPAKSLGFD